MRQLAARDLRAGRIVGSILLPLVLCVTVPGSSAGNPPSPAAAPASPSSLRSVVVTLRDRPDLHGHRGDSLRPRTVVARLRSQARVSQSSLLSQLTSWRIEGTVTDIRSLWISNAVAVTATPDVVRRIAARPDVASVRPDAIVLTAAADPTANQQAIGTPTVWAEGQTGQGVVVATLDSGVDPSDADLATQWRAGENSWFDPYGQHVEPFDATGHGTGVLGVMVGGEATGSAVGTAPGAIWIAARVFDDAGASTVSGVHQAFQWLLDPDGDPATADAPQVVNASWTIGTGPSCDLTFQPDVQALRAAGILPIFPAGNFGGAASSSASPGNYPEALSVGAVNGSDAVVSTSGRGPSDCGARSRVFPDLVAPGVDILTTDRYGLSQYLSGTSAAAPHAAGVLALLLGAHPGLTPDQQHELLTGTALDLGPAGPDDTYGGGRLDAAAAYTALPALQPDFMMQAAPTSATVAAGDATAYVVQVAPVDGFTADVDLSVTGLPTAQGTVTIEPTTVGGGSGEASLTVTAAAAATGGSFPLTVTGTSGSTTHQTQVTVEIVPSAPADQLVLSTTAAVPLPGLAGADDADLYGWDGSAFHRRFDAAGAGLGEAVDLDGLDVVSDDHFFASLERDASLPGLGTVQDEDVVEYDGGVWSVFFNGTGRGLTTGGEDIDALSVRGDTLFFSTRGAVAPPGVTGGVDDADVYKWDGSHFTRAWRATSHGVPAAADVDGLVWTSPTRLSVSFSTAGVRLPGLGQVKDEDVVGREGGSWSLWFDGSAHGLGSADGLDVDAFDLR